MGNKAEPVDEPGRTFNNGRWGIASLFVVATASLCVSLYDLPNSGEQWLDDGARYLNNGAMLRDWILSGQWSRPYEFATRNYAQYPAHSIPYHPPGYAFLLGMWFVALGMSYAAARWFIAICLLSAGVMFNSILRKQGAGVIVALIATLIFVTSPEIARWSRSAMSEIPSLALMMAGSYFFLCWEDSKKPWYCWSAFLLAAMAFFCRILSVGVVPAWFLYLITRQSRRRMFSFHLVAAAGAYVVLCGAWSKFASSFAANEVRSSVADLSQRFLTWENLTVWTSSLPAMVGWVTLGAGILGIMRSSKSRTVPSSIKNYWGIWFISYLFFLTLMAIHFESRYFIYAVPAICGLACITLVHLAAVKHGPLAVVVLTTVVLSINVLGIVQMPRGLVGYGRMAAQLEVLEDPGNVLLCCWCDSDLIFRYRCRATTSRQMIRGDRTLSIRLPKYSGVASIPLAENAQDVLDLIRKGRIRFLVTTTSQYADHDNRPEDMELAHRVVMSLPEKFSLIEQANLVFDFEQHREAKVFLWRYTGDLPLGESELPVVIPTAKITMDSGGKSVENR